MSSTFTVIDPTLGTTDPASIVQALMPTANPGIAIDAASLALTAGASSAMFYDGSLGGLGIGPGLLLTSGTTPGTANTVGYFGQDNGMAGDAALDAVVNQVFHTNSLDATKLSFTVTITDPAITGISFQAVFGSEEFPEWVNQFVDIAAVTVNGQNVAYFDNNPMAPLSVVSQNIAANYFINNADGHLPIEYDGVSAPLTIYAPVHLGENVITIGVADTRDHIYDSGLFISNLQASDVPVHGVRLDLHGSGVDDSLHGTQASEDIQGLDGNDTVQAAGGDDLVQTGLGDDDVAGGSGNDYLDGGEGSDIAAYSGKMADYSITQRPDGSWRVVDLRPGSPDGSDTLVHVETLQFADSLLDLATFQATAVAPSSFTVAAEGTAGGEVLTADAFQGVAGADPSLLSVLLPSSLPPGVTYDAATHSFLLDPTDAAYVPLSAGQVQAVTVQYAVSDGTTTTPMSFQFDVTGVNDAPQVSGPVTYQVQEYLTPYSSDGEVENEVEVEVEIETETLDDGIAGAAIVPNSVNMLANASDPDQLDTLSVVDLPATLPPGISHIHVDAAFTPTGEGGAMVYHPAVDLLVIDPKDPAFDSLAQGETMTISVAYGVSDGSATTPAEAVFTITGTNDAPVVSGDVAALATEDGGAVTVDALANATDIDHGAVLNVTNAVDGETEANDQPGISGSGHAEDDGVLGVVQSQTSFDLANLPPGVTFDATTQSFTLDPGDPAYQYLSAGETVTVTVQYGVTDGIATVDAHAVFTITGTNDAPVVVGPATLTIAEAVPGAALADTSGADTPELQAPETHGIGPVLPPGAIDLLAMAQDPDHLDTLSVVDLPATLPAGVSYVALPAYTSTTGQYQPAGHALVLDPADPAFDSLADGETLTIRVTYGVTDGTATTPAEAVFTVVGTNDAPVVNGVLASLATEDAGALVVDALALAGDVDHGAVLTVTAPPPVAMVPGDSTQDAVDDTLAATAAPDTYDIAALPDGIAFDAATQSFTLDPSAAAFQSLSEGEARTITIRYGVTDGMAVTAATATFTVTGTNDLPIVTGSQSQALTAGGAPVTLDLLANASDVDHLDKLSVVLPLSLPPGVEVHMVSPGYYMPEVPVLSFNPQADAFRSLAAGETATVHLDYGVTDGHGTVAAGADFVVTGVNDAPVVATPAGGMVVEDGAGLTVDALGTAFDWDNGAVLSVVNVPAVLPAGITYDAATHSFSIDPTAAVFQELGEGEAHTYSVGYGITDGIVTTQTSVEFTVIGTNDVPIVSGPVTGSPNEDGQIVSVNAAGNATDVDAHQGLQVTGVPGTLPAGVTYDAATQRFSLDPSDAAYQSLAKGESVEVTVQYAIFDGVVEVPTSVVFTVSGRNDAPVVSGAVLAAASEDAGSVAVNLLAKASDIDHGSSLAVANGLAGVTAAVVGGTWSAPVQFVLDGSNLVLGAGQFNALGAGETVELRFSYAVTDGDKSADAAASTRVVITGANDAPTALALNGTHVAENSAAGTVIGQFAATDADRGDSFSYQLLSNPSGAFAISGGKLLVAAGAVLDYETLASQAITVRVTDAAGGSFDQAFTIAIDNVLGVTLKGTSKNDVLGAGVTTAEEDFIDANGGNDIIDAGAGADTILGGAGNDSIQAGAGNDSIDGGVDKDTILGGAGDDTIVIRGNEAQTDVIDAGSTGETIGDRILVQGTGGVVLNGFDAGQDGIEIWTGNGRELAGTSAAERFDLSALRQVTGLSFMDGGDGNDLMIGSLFADDLRGGAGSDTLRGGAGADTLDGGAGNDVIQGDAGADVLKGGAGADVFVFNRGGGQDVVADFVAGSGSGHDVLDLDRAMFADFGAVQAGMVQSGADVILGSGADAITIKSVTVASLVASDFLFH